ncbi:MAG: ABC transporter ATP-binding protein [Anaerolineaceae bacterium]|nr:ABC transporter ATP-binding protein [Anaerolineaceae bacterium]
MSYLTLKNLTKSFNENIVIKDVDLAVEKGEFVSFLGPSGCGKTTTLRMVAGFEAPSTGQIFLDGAEITGLPPSQRNLGMVFQSYALFPNMTVYQNIAFGLEVKHVPAVEIRTRVNEMLSIIQMQAYGHRFPSQLSGGQQQRVALARALASHPRVLLLDEPLSALDAKIRVELRQEIRQIQQELKITAIYVTHDQEEAFALSDRVVVMKDGVIEQAGKPFEIYNYPASQFVATFVGQINLLPVTMVDHTQMQVSVGQRSIQVGRMGERADKLPLLAIRYEEIKPGHREGCNNLRGKVSSLAYLGAILRCHIDFDGMDLVMDLFNEKTLALPEVGSEIDFHFSQEACWLLW